MSFATEIVKSVSNFRVLIKIDSNDYSGRFSFNNFTPIGSSEPYDGRLLKAPNISITRDSSFFGRLSHSSSTFSLANTDGYFNTLIENYSIIGSTIRIFIGFKDINISDYVNIYTGFLDSISVNVDSLDIIVIDIRKKLDTVLNNYWVNQNGLSVLKEIILDSDSTISYTSTYFDTTTWDAAQLIAPNITAFSTNNPLTIENIAQNICVSLFGNLFITGDGRYSFMYIDESASAITTIGKNDIINDYSISYDTTKILSEVIVHYDVAQFLVSSTSSFVVTDTSRDSYVFNKYKLHKQQEYTTYLIGPTAASVYASNVLDYYYEVHGEFSIVVPFKYYALNIGNIVAVELYRNNQSVLGTRNCEVMGVSYNLENATIQLDLRLVGTPAVFTQTTTTVTQYQPVGGAYVAAAISSSSSALTSLLPRFRGVFSTDPVSDNREGDTYYNNNSYTVMGFLTGAWVTASGTFTYTGVGADVAGAAASAYTNAVAAANLYTASVDSSIRNNMAAKFGFTDWATMSLVASAIGPILNAGYLNATVIDVQALFAQNIAILSTGSIFSGTGTYGTSTTGVYLDASGKFSLKDRFLWTGTSLTLVNASLSAGNISGVTISSGTIYASTIYASTMYDNSSNYHFKLTPGNTADLMRLSNGYIDSPSSGDKSVVVYLVGSIPYIAFSTYTAGWNPVSYISGAVNYLTNFSTNHQSVYNGSSGASGTYGQIYDILTGDIPATGDTCLLHGGWGIGSDAVDVVFMQRIDASTIRFYVRSYNSGAYTIDMTHSSTTSVTSVYIYH